MAVIIMQKLKYNPRFLFTTIILNFTHQFASRREYEITLAKSFHTFYSYANDM